MSVLWLVSGRLRYSTAAQRRHSNIPSPHCARVGIIIDAAVTVLFPEIHKVTPACGMEGLLAGRGSALPHRLPNEMRPNGFQRAQIDRPSFVIGHGTGMGMIEPSGKGLKP